MIAEFRTSVFVSSEQFDAGDLLSRLGGPLRVQAVQLKNRRDTDPPRFPESVLRIGSAVVVATADEDLLATALDRLGNASARDVPEGADLSVQLACEYSEHCAIRLRAEVIERLAALRATLDVSLTRLFGETENQATSGELINVGAEEASWNNYDASDSTFLTQHSITATIEGVKLVFPIAWGAQGAELDDHIRYILRDRKAGDGLPTNLLCLITGGIGEPAGFLSTEAIGALDSLGAELTIMVSPLLALPGGAEPTQPNRPPRRRH